MHPIAPMPPLLKLVKASASSELAVPYNGRPQTADRLIEGPNDGRWCSVPRGPPSIGVPRPANSAWFSLQLEHRSVINSFYIRWKTAYGHVGARPMKYKVLSSLDGKSWTDTGVDQRLVRGLPPNLAVDVLPGWPDPTQFIKVEMSESSYGTDGYFSCHYVLVTGRAL
jgi:F5/8 type C domain